VDILALQPVGLYELTVQVNIFLGIRDSIVPVIAPMKEPEALIGEESELGLQVKLERVIEHISGYARSSRKPLGIHD
jgi:hypothetical protein